MRERTTRKQLEAQIEMLNRTLGRPLKAWQDGKAQVGHFHLDYAACYGGFEILEMSNERGGCRHPFGSQRMGARECWNVLYALNGMAAMIEQEQGGKLKGKR